VTRKSILKIAIDIPLSRVFDYQAPSSVPLPSPGQRVLVPFGRHKRIGMIMDYSDHSEIPKEKLKECLEILDTKPILSEENIWLIRFTSNYYHHPIGEVVFTAIPSLLRKGHPLSPLIEKYVINEKIPSKDILKLKKRAPKQARLFEILHDAGNDGLDTKQLNEKFPNWRNIRKGLIEKNLISLIKCQKKESFEKVEVADNSGPILNKDQENVLSNLRLKNSFGVYLLDGITGSGKTEVYLQRIQDILDRGRQVLILVPEIGLTPQLIRRLTNRLGITPALLHSGLNDKKRLRAWRAARSGASQLVVGTRSAVFTPMKKLGLIIVDEEHDQSFKQQEGLRYSARDLAIARAKNKNIPIILGSATPSFEILQHCRNGAYKHLLLPKRAGNAIPPVISLIDISRSPTKDGISEPLYSAIQQTLNDKAQVLIFLNRRGFAPTLICKVCGNIACCKRCDSRLTVHLNSQQLRCHHCGENRQLINKCEKCGETVKPLGEGTQRLEKALKERFPNAIVKRVDSDTTQVKGSLDKVIQSASSGEADILVGTQMLSKGHHFPALKLVGIVNADQGLFGTDFRCEERMAQSIIQVAGRAGRAGRAGKVLIQTAFPNNNFWHTLFNGGYKKIAEIGLDERKNTSWPPFTYLALIRSSAFQYTDAYSFLNKLKIYLSKNKNLKLKILGPVEAPMARKAGRHRAQLLLQSIDRLTLHHSLDTIRIKMESDTLSRKTRWSIDVDPIELL
tara:strand:- start:2711 stop:4918 length:2208 start_codon:yes stop_codon:yes gene_type:complete